MPELSGVRRGGPQVVSLGVIILYTILKRNSIYSNPPVSQNLSPGDYCMFFGHPGYLCSDRIGVLYRKDISDICRFCCGYRHSTDFIFSQTAAAQRSSPSAVRWMLSSLRMYLSMSDETSAFRSFITTPSALSFGTMYALNSSMTLLLL